MLMFRQLELTRVHTHTLACAWSTRYASIRCVIFARHTFGAHMLRRAFGTSSSLSHPLRTFSQVLLDVVTKFNVIQFGIRALAAISLAGDILHL